MSDSLWPHWLAHTAPLVYDRLLESAQVHDCISDVIQPSHPLLPHLLLPSIFPSIRVFSNESVFLPQEAKVARCKFWFLQYGSKRTLFSSCSVEKSAGKVEFLDFHICEVLKNTIVLRENNKVDPLVLSFIQWFIIILPLRDEEKEKSWKHIIPNGFASFQYKFLQLG